MYDTILVPLDGSERAESILSFVENIAKHNNSRVVFLIVEESLPMLGQDETIDVDKFLQDRNVKLRKSRAYLAALQTKLREKGIDAHYLIDTGSVVQSILDKADMEAADLVAMSSHGKSGLERTFYGSVAAGVLNRIDRPLLIVRSRYGFKKSGV